MKDKDFSTLLHVHDGFPKKFKSFLENQWFVNIIVLLLAVLGGFGIHFNSCYWKWICLSAAAFKSFLWIIINVYTEIRLAVWRWKRFK